MANEDLYNAVIEIDNSYGDRMSMEEFNSNMEDPSFAEDIEVIVGDTVKKKGDSDSTSEEEVTESITEEEEIPTSSESLEKSDSTIIEQGYNPETFREFIQQDVFGEKPTIPQIGAEPPTTEPSFEITPEAQDYYAEIDRRNKQAWSGGTPPMTNDDMNKLRKEMGVEDVVPVVTDFIQVEEGGFTPLNKQVNDLIREEAEKQGRSLAKDEEKVQQLIKLGKALHEEERKKWQAESEKIGKLEKDTKKATEKKRQLEISQSMQLKESLDKFDEIMAQVVPTQDVEKRKESRLEYQKALNEAYGKYGLVFSEGGFGGELLNVSTTDGSVEESFSLSANRGKFWGGEPDFKALKDFIAQNADIDPYFMEENMDEVERSYDEFMASKGLNGKAIRKASADLENVRYKLAVAEKLQSNDWNLSDYDERTIAMFPDLFVETSIGGKGKQVVPRSDLDEIIERLEVEENQLDDLVGENFSHNFNPDIMEAQQEWDVIAAEKRKELAQTMSQANTDAEVKQKQVEYDSFMYFNKPMFKDGKFNIQPEDLKTEEDEDAFLRYYNQFTEAAVDRQTAADAYRDAYTYLSLQKNKQIKGEYLNTMDGLWANIEKNLAIGEAGKAAAELSVDMEDSSLEDRQGAAQEIVKYTNLSESYGTSRALADIHSAHGFINSIAAWARNPAEVSFGFFSGSMSMMLPYGKWLVLGGGATGAGLGALYGGAMGSAAGGVGAIPGAIAGAGTGLVIGLRGGMASAAFGMEYTNALLESITHHGYNIKDPESVAQALGDEEVWSWGMDRGVKRGIPIAVVDYLTASAAGKLFISDVSCRAGSMGAGFRGSWRRNSSTSSGTRI